MMPPLESIIETYGYLALFAGTFLEGEVILILAGFAAHQGFLQLPWVIFTALAGSMAGDQLYFFIGRSRGTAFLEKRPHWHSRAIRVRELLTRYQILLTLGFRFAYGFRTVTPFVLGMSDIPTPRFVLLNAVAALIWAATVGTGGYLFGAALETFIGMIKHIELELMAAIAVTGIVVWAVKSYFRRKRG